jgi:hypothetical protein
MLAVKTSPAVSSLVSKISRSLAPSVSQALAQADALPAAAKILASRNVGDPLIWSEVFRLAESADLPSRAEICLSAMNCKFLHSRILKRIFGEISDYQEISDILHVLRVAERLETDAIYLRASERVQQLEISRLSEISSLLFAFRKHPDPRLFAFLLKKVGKKIQAAENSECIEMLENMGRAKLRDLRTVHSLIDKIMESEISSNFLLAMEKLKIIYGRERIVQKYLLDISDSPPDLSVVAALASLGADTRNFLEKVGADLPADMDSLRALSGSSAGRSDVSDLFARFFFSSNSPRNHREAAFILLASADIRRPGFFENWSVVALKKLRDAISEGVVEAPGGDAHVCAQRLRKSVTAVVEGMGKEGTLKTAADVMGCLVVEDGGKKRAKKQRKRSH